MAMLCVVQFRAANSQIHLDYLVHLLSVGKIITNRRNSRPIMPAKTIQQRPNTEAAVEWTSLESGSRRGETLMRRRDHRERRRSRHSNQCPDTEETSPKVAFRATSRGPQLGEDTRLLISKKQVPVTDKCFESCRHMLSSMMMTCLLDSELVHSQSPETIPTDL
jgi:hypothetical protein